MGVRELWLPVGEHDWTEVLPAGAMLRKRFEDGWMADAQNVRLSYPRWVNAWSAAGKRFRHRREDLARDAGVAAIVDDLQPNAFLHHHGPVAEIGPEEITVRRRVLHRPCRGKLVPLNRRRRLAGESPVADSPALHAGLLRDLVVAQAGLDERHRCPIAGNVVRHLRT